MYVVWHDNIFINPHGFISIISYAAIFVNKLSDFGKGRFLANAVRPYGYITYLMLLNKSKYFLIRPYRSIKEIF